VHGLFVWLWSKMHVGMQKRFHATAAMQEVPCNSFHARASMQELPCKTFQANELPSNSLQARIFMQELPCSIQWDEGLCSHTWKAWSGSSGMSSPALRATLTTSSGTALCNGRKHASAVLTHLPGLPDPVDCLAAGTHNTLLP